MAEIIIGWLNEYVFDRTINYEYTDSFKERFTPDMENIEYTNNLKLNPREYQEECVKLAQMYKFGTFVLGTGAGKTFTIASILDNLFSKGKIKKALILVPDNGLVTQFNEELKEIYGITQKINLFYDKFNRIDKDAEIVIANRPLFLARWTVMEKFWKNEIDCLIVDEAHSIKRNNKVSKMLEKLPALYRFGFTGTLAENKEDMYKNLGILGPVRYEKTSKELRDEGFLSDVIIRILKLDYPIVTKAWSYQDELEILEQDPLRNDFIAKLLLAMDKNTLILVNHLDHGFTIEDCVNKQNIDNKKKIYFIRGEIDNDTRDEIKKLMEKEDNIICIAITKIFSTGINIKNIHNIVLAAGGKSAVTVVQSIGRGLRLHPEKKSLTIWDISDNGYKYSSRHAEKRKEIYKKERINTANHDIILKNNG